MAKRLPEPEGRTKPAYSNIVLLPGIDTTGYSGKYHRIGTKIVDITDRDGTPLTLVFSSGNRHDYPLAAEFRQELRQRGIKTNIPQRQYRKRRKRGRPARYDQELEKQRFVVERTNSWLKSFRRIRFRYDYSLASFRGFVLLACTEPEFYVKMGKRFATGLMLNYTFCYLS